MLRSGYKTYTNSRLRIRKRMIQKQFHRVWSNRRSCSTSRWCSSRSCRRHSWSSRSWRVIELGKMNLLSNITVSSRTIILVINSQTTKKEGNVLLLFVLQIYHRAGVSNTRPACGPPDMIVWLASSSKILKLQLYMILRNFNPSCGPRRRMRSQKFNMRNAICKGLL